MDRWEAAGCVWLKGELTRVNDRLSMALLLGVTATVPWFLFWPWIFVGGRRSSSSAPRRDSAEPRPRGCSGLGEPRPALPSF